MAQRVSGYIRRDFEFYPSPGWVVGALAEHVDLRGKTIWEPACGTGEMSDAIRAAGAALVHSTDIKDYGYSGFDGIHDFVAGSPPPLITFDGTITNPPYGERGRLAELFIENGLRQIGERGFLALLLPADFDAAKTRAKYFERCPLYAGQITLTRRIKWFDEELTCKKCGGTGKVNGLRCAPCRGTGKKKSDPSQNHCWQIWQRTWVGGRQMPWKMYAPSAETKSAAAA